MNYLFPYDIRIIEEAKYIILTIPNYQNIRYESLTAIFILKTKKLNVMQNRKNRHHFFDCSLVFI